MTDLKPEVEAALCRVAHRDYSANEPTEEHDSNLLRAHIATLEAQVAALTKQRNAKQREIVILRTENKALRETLAYAKRQGR